MPVARKTQPIRRRAGQPLPRPKPPVKISSPWRLRRVNGMQVLELEPLRKLPWLVHGFSTRTGGSSQLPSGERILNLSFMDWDRREAVAKNRAAFQKVLSAERMELIALKQIHSAVVQPFAAKPGEPCKGDASVTLSKNLLLGIQTADCVPILIVDPKKRAVAAIHAGWRGTLARVAEKTVGEMRARFGSHPKNLIAAIGPAIGVCCYEVGTELVTEFSSQFADAEEYFDELRTGEEPNPLQWLNMMPPGHQPPPRNVRLDLRKANVSQLRAAGLAEKNIYVSDLCTACHRRLLFSYRKEGPVSGRQLSVIGIRG
jgi:YfiH family protein